MNPVLPAPSTAWVAIFEPRKPTPAATAERTMPAICPGLCLRRWCLTRAWRTRAGFLWRRPAWLEARFLLCLAIFLLPFAGFSAVKAMISPGFERLFLRTTRTRRWRRRGAATVARLCRLAPGLCFRLDLLRLRFMLAFAAARWRGVPKWSFCLRDAFRGSPILRFLRFPAGLLAGFAITVVTSATAMLQTLFYCEACQGRRITTSTVPAVDARFVF